METGLQHADTEFPISGTVNQRPFLGANSGTSRVHGVRNVSRISNSMKSMIAFQQPRRGMPSQLNVVPPKTNLTPAH